MNGRSVVLGLGRSPGADRALERGVRLARSLGVPLVLVHGVPRPVASEVAAAREAIEEFDETAGRPAAAAVRAVGLRPVHRPSRVVRWQSHVPRPCRTCWPAGCARPTGHRPCVPCGGSTSRCAGEFVALTGPSGSGKSTLLHLVARAGPGRRGHGRAGRRAHGGPGRRAACPVAAPPRRAGLPVLPPRRAPVGAGERGARRAGRRGAADGGDGPRPRPARHPGPAGPFRAASRRALRRAAPAGGDRAGAGQPTLLLADEPTGALDSDGAAEVLELFARLHRTGQTILMVTHSREVAAGAQRIVRMRDGRAYDDGPPSDDPGPDDPGTDGTAVPDDAGHRAAGWFA